MKGGALKYLFKKDVVVKGVKVSYSESLELAKYPNAFWIPISQKAEYSDYIVTIGYYNPETNNFVQLNNKRFEKIYKVNKDNKYEVFSGIDGFEKFIVANNYSYEPLSFTYNQCVPLVRDFPLDDFTEKCYNSGIFAKPSQEEYNRKAANNTRRVNKYKQNRADEMLRQAEEKQAYFSSPEKKDDYDKMKQLESEYESLVSEKNELKCVSLKTQLADKIVEIEKPYIESINNIVAEMKGYVNKLNYLRSEINELKRTQGVYQWEPNKSQNAIQRNLQTAEVKQGEYDALLKEYKSKEQSLRDQYELLNSEMTERVEIIIKEFKENENYNEIRCDEIDKLLTNYLQQLKKIEITLEYNYWEKYIYPTEKERSNQDPNRNNPYRSYASAPKFPGFTSRYPNSIGGKRKATRRKKLNKRNRKLTKRHR
jgi:hypothetical protein